MDRIKGLFTSKGVFALFAALMVVVADGFGLTISEQHLTGLIASIVAWVGADAVRPSTEFWKSKRLWAAVAGVVAAITAGFGLPIDPVTVDAIIAFAIGVIFKDTVREIK